jgi:hypothetical protein
MVDAKVQATLFEAGAAAEPAVGLDEAGAFIHPGEQVFLALGKAGRGFTAAKVLLAGLMGPHFGARRLEGRQAIEMVGVVMGQDDPFHGLAAELADGGEQGIAQRRGAEGVDDDDAIPGDDESGIAVEALIGPRSHAGVAKNIPGMLRDANGLQGLGRCIARLSQRKQQGGGEGDDGVQPGGEGGSAAGHRRSPQAMPGLPAIPFRAGRLRGRERITFCPLR